MVEGDGSAGVFMRWVTAFHGEDDGFGAVAEVGQLLAGEFVKQYLQYLAIIMAIGTLGRLPKNKSLRPLSLIL